MLDDVGVIVRLFVACNEEDVDVWNELVDGGYDVAIVGIYLLVDCLFLYPLLIPLLILLPKPVVNDAR